MSRLIINNTGYKFNRCTLYDSDDASKAVGRPYKTAKCDGSMTRLILNNATLYAGKTYYIRIKYRTRGDGNSTSSKCSSVGFIAYWNNWASARGYCRNSETAYNERGEFVDWTYSFTVDEDVTPTDTSLYFIIQNGWANGADNQTIDLYNYMYWDSDGKILDYMSDYQCTHTFLKIKKSGKTYYKVGHYNAWGIVSLKNYTVPEPFITAKMLSNKDNYTTFLNKNLINASQLISYLNTGLLENRRLNIIIRIFNTNLSSDYEDNFIPVAWKNNNNTYEFYNSNGFLLFSGYSSWGTKHIWIPAILLPSRYNFNEICPNLSEYSYEELEKLNFTYSNELQRRLQI